MEHYHSFLFFTGPESESESESDDDYESESESDELESEDDDEEEEDDELLDDYSPYSLLFYYSSFLTTCF